VTVIDDILPTITCSIDVQVSTDANSCEATGVTLIDPVTSDNCSILSLTNDAPTTFPIGDTDVTWTVTDNSGNINTCIQVVTVVDDIDPDIICPTDEIILVNSGELFSIPDYTVTATATDNCTTSPTITQNPIEGTEVGVGITVITLTATDESGNSKDCTFSVTVDEILGIGDSEIENEIVLFPNPTDNELTIINKSNQQILSASLFDINGRLIQKFNFNNGTPNTKISLENFSVGIYFVSLQTNKTTIIKRIVKH
jgi:hypothetical protein